MTTSGRQQMRMAGWRLAVMAGPWVVAAVLAGPLGCAKTALAPGGIGEACLLNGDCATGFVCTGSRCALPANLGGCEPATKRCNGAEVEQCTADGLGYARTETCVTGCTGGACRPQVCTPGAQRCAGEAAEACTPTGDGWALVQICATHCNPDTGRCRSPACAPFSARCDPSGAANVWVCDSYGSGYVITACATGEACVRDRCQSNNANCHAGELRCNGTDVQRCVDGSTPGTTQWAAQGACLAGCSGGACNPGGSCAGVKLQAAVQSVPLDGESSVLVYTDSISGLDGTLLPDGQLFTVTASATGAAPSVLSPDADGARAGTQVKSVGGRVHFTVRAPPAASSDAVGTFTVQLAAGGSCGASAGTTFTSAPAPGVLVAEDFRSPSLRNVGATNADWNSDQGVLSAGSPVEPGTGVDGDLVVAGGSTTNLSNPGGLMPAFVVSTLSGATLTLAGNAAGLAGGDEVLLWDAQGLGGQSVNAGSFETARVLSVTGPTVTLTAPVRGTFGALGDQNVSAQRVVVQRIPQLASLLVAAGGILTAKAWDGATGGVLFVRVKGVAHVVGTVSMDAKGFRGASSSGAGEDLSGRPGAAGAAGSGAGGTSCGGGHGTAGACATGGTLPGAVVGTALLSKVILGAGGGPGTAGGATGGAGGGVVVLAADTLRLDGDADVPAPAFQGHISADGAAGFSGGGGGAGGSIWLQARTLVGGSDPAVSGAGILARGGQAASPGAGGAGRIRVDALASDRLGLSAGCARAAPACTFGVNGPLTAQSLDAYVAGSRVIRQATLLTALSPGAAGPSGFDYFASAIGNDLPDFSPKLVLGTPTDFVPAPGNPQLGNRFRWRIEAIPPPGAAQRLLALQWYLKVN